VYIGVWQRGSEVPLDILQRSQYEPSAARNPASGCFPARWRRAAAWSRQPPVRDRRGAVIAPAKTYCSVLIDPRAVHCGANAQRSGTRTRGGAGRGGAREGGRGGARRGTEGHGGARRGAGGARTSCSSASAEREWCRTFPPSLPTVAPTRVPTVYSLPLPRRRGKVPPHRRLGLMEDDGPGAPSRLPRVRPLPPDRWGERIRPRPPPAPCSRGGCSLFRAPRVHPPRPDPRRVLRRTGIPA